ncbi:MAG: site-2 protease family protein [Micrococcales bacterium]|nr:site-2 protease family protein [Micrococcales bacterium]MCL2666383.1 site-2 protease family protein [Micrococcales bacterium]
MANVVGVVIFVIGILVSIGLHEIGHMIPAKKFGVRVSQYMIGFGPTIWSKVKGETEYGFKWILLGGYVRLVGTYPTDEAVGASEPTTWWGRMAADARAASAEEIAPGEDHRAVYRLSTPKKLAVMLGGPMMNLLVAMVLVGVVIVGIGHSAGTTTVSKVAACVPTGAQDAKDEKDTCAGADEQVSPAVAAGVQPGDKIVSWDGKNISSWGELYDTIGASAGRKVEIVVERDGQKVTLGPVAVAQVGRDAGGNVVPVGSSAAVRTAGFMGITPTSQVVREPVSKVPGVVASTTWQVVGVVVQLPQKVWDVGASTVRGEKRDPESVMSVVGISRVAGEVTALEEEGTSKVATLLFLLAMLNISLFVFNLIPLPPLDGGHIAAALWEGGRRQLSRWRRRDVSTVPADTARLVPIGFAVFIALAVMGGVLIIADFVNPIRPF